MLAVDGVTAQYGRIIALRGVSLKVDPGEFVAVIGPNGAGKSTLLLAIAGALKPTSGSIAFDGQSIVGRAPEQIVKQGLALVPEGRHIFQTLTVAENLLLGATSQLGKSGERSGAVDQVLELFPVLRDRYRQRAGKLSGGEQQQLAIARALLAKPRLLLLDEPSLGLAPQLVDVVFDALETLRADGLTILLVEQNAAAAVDAADRSYVLRSGRVALSGTRGEMAAMENFDAALLGFSEAASRT